MVQYIWEMFYRDKYPGIHLIQSENVSPYYEMNPMELRIQEKNKISYNGLVRYKKIFMNMYKKMQGDMELFRIFFDVFSRFLIETDLSGGMSLNESRRRRIISEMREGCYGEKVKHLVRKIEEDDIYRISHYVNLRQQSGETDPYMFARAVTSLLKGGTVYYSRDAHKKLWLYVGNKHNFYQESLIELAEEMLLPIGVSCEILWEKHFGMIDEEAIMLIDKMIII